jgi:hypothetical protein
VTLRLDRPLRLNNDCRPCRGAWPLVGDCRQDDEKADDHGDKDQSADRYPLPGVTIGYGLGHRFGSNSPIAFRVYVGGHGAWAVQAVTRGLYP